MYVNEKRDTVSFFFKFALRIMVQKYNKKELL